MYRRLIDAIEEALNKNFFMLRFKEIHLFNDVFINILAYCDVFIPKGAIFDYLNRILSIGFNLSDHGVKNGFDFRLQLFYGLDLLFFASYRGYPSL